MAQTAVYMVPTQKGLKIAIYIVPTLKGPRFTI